MTFEKLLKTTDVAAVLNLTPWQVRKMVRDGTLQAVKLGHRTLRYRPSVLRRFLTAAESKTAVPIKDSGSGDPQEKKTLQAFPVDVS